jgi:hypothetical protein
VESSFSPDSARGKKVDFFGEDAILREFLASGGGCGISSAMGKRKNLHGVEKDGSKTEKVSEKIFSWNHQLGETVKAILFSQKNIKKIKM